MKIRAFTLLLSVVFVLTACGTSDNGADTELNEPGSQAEKTESEEYPQLMDKNEELPIAEMQTSLGNITIKLFPEQAPKAVENFIAHSKNGYYDGVIFHRVMQDFMVQGGDPEGTGRGGESIWGEPFENEISPVLFHLRGALSMANAGPDTNGSQFFIVQNQNVDHSSMKKNYSEEIKAAYENGGTPWLDGAHTVFGQVIEGMEVVDQIAAVEVGNANMPVEDVIIKKITISE